jgi:hypothetical protein
MQLQQLAHHFVIINDQDVCNWHFQQPLVRGHFLYLGDDYRT